MVEIKNMEQKHIENVKQTMRFFYGSPAVLTTGSEKIFQMILRNVSMIILIWKDMFL